MGYQALLFCPDEKLARVVTQVFTDLEFSVEPVNEPFAAVKKLMAQRYDAIVVDCENEQNASLLFKSARNSSSNQSSLALALVLGQAGVAKAYRIGANLVLTKPINVEQAKGTLRVARGLLRKSADAAPSSTPAKPIATPAANTIRQPNPETAAVLSEPDTFEAPELESPLPAMAASAEEQLSPIATPAPEATTRLAAEPTSNARPEPVSPVRQKPVSAPTVVPIVQPAVTASTAIASAAAPAPAKEPPAVEKPSTAPEFVGHASVSAVPSTPVVVQAPSFAALDKGEQADGAGGSKKIFIAVAAVLALAALGFFGWSRFSSKSANTQVASAPQNVTTPATQTPAVAPQSQSAPAPTQSSPQTSTAAPASSQATSAATVPAPSKPSASTPVPTPRTESENDVAVVKKPAIVVKSSSSAKKSSQQSEESAPQLPNPLALEPANDKHISSLVASVPVNLPKAAPSDLRISQGVSQGLLIKKVPPRYPQNALSMHLQGMVQLEATIDKEGNVKNLKVASGDAILARAAMDAVRQWRYKPYYLDGDPVEIQTQITINFKLPGN